MSSKRGRARGGGAARGGAAAAAPAPASSQSAAHTHAPAHKDAPTADTEAKAGGKAAASAAAVDSSSKAGKSPSKTAGGAASAAASIAPAAAKTADAHTHTHAHTHTDAGTHTGVRAEAAKSAGEITALRVSGAAMSGSLSSGKDDEDWSVPYPAFLSAHPLPAATRVPTHAHTMEAAAELVMRRLQAVCNGAFFVYGRKFDAAHPDVPEADLAPSERWQFLQWRRWYAAAHPRAHVYCGRPLRNPHIARVAGIGEGNKYKVYWWETNKPVDFADPKPPAALHVDEGVQLYHSNALCDIDYAVAFMETSSTVPFPPGLLSVLLTRSSTNADKRVHVDVHYLWSAAFFWEYFGSCGPQDWDLQLAITRAALQPEHGAPSLTGSLLAVLGSVLPAARELVAASTPAARRTEALPAPSSTTSPGKSASTAAATTTSPPAPAAAARGVDACATCGKRPAPSDPPLSRCAACWSVAYCSVACQSQDWKRRHRAECRRKTAENEASAATTAGITAAAKPKSSSATSSPGTATNPKASATPAAAASSTGPKKDARST